MGNKVIGSCFKQAIGSCEMPKNEHEIAGFITELMDKCDKIGETTYHQRPNQNGRCRGDWFELAIEKVLGCFLKNDQFKAYPGRGHKIREIKGFEKVDWIPMPDAIFKSITDLRGVLTLKWGMRHDRMYEAGYEAYAIKDWAKRTGMPEPVIFLVTNDAGPGFESRLLTMSKVPAVDGVYFVNYSQLSPKLKIRIKSIPDLISDINRITQ